jgi:hypothetical protein
MIEYLLDHQLNAEQEGGDANYILESLNRQNYPTLNATSTEYVLRVPPLPPNALNRTRDENIRDMRERIDRIVTELIRGMGPSDWIGLYLHNDRLEKPIWIPHRRADQLDADAIMSVIEKLLTSDLDFMFEGVFSLRVIHVRVPVGGGRKRFDMCKSFRDNLAKHTRCVHLVKNDDNLCMIRAIVLGKAYADRHENGDWNTMRRKTHVKEEGGHSYHTDKRVRQTVLVKKSQPTD